MRDKIFLKTLILFLPSSSKWDLTGSKFWADYIGLLDYFEMQEDFREK